MTLKFKPLDPEKVKKLKCFRMIDDGKVYFIDKAGIVHRCETLKVAEEFLMNMYQLKIQYSVDENKRKTPQLIMMRRGFFPDQNDRFLYDEINEMYWYNEFTPTEFLKEKNTLPEYPRCYRALFDNLFPDAETYKYFINWLAYIVQRRGKTTTAIVLLGTQGTGKTILAEKLLRKIFGSAHSSADSGSLTTGYNGFAENCLILSLNEIFIDKKDKHGVATFLKNVITEDKIKIKEKYKPEYLADCYANVMITTNDIDAIKVPANDRRFSFSESRFQRLEQHPEAYPEMFGEMFNNDMVGALVDFLRGVKVDDDLVRKTVGAVVKQQAVESTSTYIDIIVNEVKNADYTYTISTLENADLDGSITPDKKMQIHKLLYSTIPSMQKLAEDKKVVLKKDIFSIIQSVGEICDYGLQKPAAIGRVLLRNGFKEGPRIQLSDMTRERTFKW